jgi:NAD(P)-dependent dehydrogenase (short-subunit alcohol dehydrogenase family)
MEVTMSTLSFDGKVAVITGAGGGLGRQHALLLAKRGALVVVNDLGGSVDGTGSSESAAQKVVDEITAAGGEAVANYDSVATPEGGEAIVKKAVDTFGRIDIVINNAGILRDKTFHNMTPDLMNPVLDVHLKGAFHVTRPAWLHMREQGYGRIVSTSSAAGVFGNFGQTNYGAAKMGLVGFTRVLAVEGAKYNIKANAIAPLALTRMTEDIMGPLGDKLAPELVSPIAAWLAHEDCDVSGEVYSVGGGRVARVFIGETKGFYKSNLSMEDIRDNWKTIRNTDGYFIPSNIGEETAYYMEVFKNA